ncbi:protein containing Peptidase C1A, papain [Candidatus Magnetomorum sp. HK-1]|nr:protein containing Peptidase C1A, papain [Candidatus Magnetomorum sp. HK-1]
MNKKSYYLLFIIFIQIAFLMQSSNCSESPEMKTAPLNPEFIKFQQKLKQLKLRNRTSRNSSDEILTLGLIPDPAISEKHQPTSDENKDIPDFPLYDLRDPNNDGNLNDCLLTPVRNQLTCGACWSFATYGALENYLKTNANLTDDINNFSENHMRYNHGFDIGSCSGGNMKMSAAYLLMNKGPINESDDPYHSLSNGFSCQECMPERYIDSVVFMPGRFDIYDIGYIKQAVYKHGGLYSSMYFDENKFFQIETSTYYYDDPDNSYNDSNHAIVIVGWNDDKEIPNAPDKGAFIVRNSFGSDWGENGYFYVSYYDESIAFTKLGYIVDLADHLFPFNKIYQYDELGWTGSIGTGDGSDWAANVFLADESIKITGIGFYTTGSNMTCSLNIYQNIKNENGSAIFSETLLETPKTNIYKYSGFYILQLDKPLVVSKGKSFVVVINYVGSENPYGIPIETPILGYSSDAKSIAGQSYVSDDGNLFLDLTALSPNANNCIKAYATKFEKTLPVAIAQEIHTKEDTELSIKLSGTDVFNKELNYLVLSYPQHGLLSGYLPDLTFTPDPNYYGTDLFDFIVSNGLESSESASITIIVEPVNDPPKAKFTSIRINEDESFSLSSVGSDPDGDFVYCYIAKTSINGTISNTFPERIYTPNKNYFGQDRFSFYLNDGKISTGSMTMDIVIDPVNDKPLVYDHSITLYEDTTKAIVLNGSDIENDRLVFYIVKSPSHGGISGIPPNLIYTPNPNFSGSDVFTFKANDGLIDSDLAHCYITVHSMNDQPTANDITVTLTEGQSVLFSLSGSDNETESLVYIIKSNPEYGQITGTLPDLIYTPNKGFYGQDKLTYQVDDGNQLSDVAIINLIVLRKNNAPVVDNMTLFLIENTSKSITLIGSDSNNDTLSFSIAKHPEHGEINGILPNITYVPNLNYSGVDKFTYTAHDGYVQSLPGQVLVFIKHVNYKPKAQSESIIIGKNESKSFYLNASDQNNDSLSYLIVIQPLHGKLSGNFPFITYTPDIDFTGFDSFSFKVNDGQIDSNYAEISIIVTEFSMVTDTIDLDKSAVTILSENFEGDTAAWTFGTGGQANKWFAGTADSYSGSTSAYISQDNGATATYDENTASVSWLSRTVDLSGYIDANLSFYWKGVGEEFLFVWYDYGEFYINNGADVLISNAKEFVDNNIWTQKNFDLSEYAGGSIDLKFKWTNDGSSKDGDPAFCIDNVQISGSQIKSASGNALDFDGDNDYVALSDGIVTSDSLNMPLTITVEAWIKANSFTYYAGIVGFVKDNGALEGGWILGVQPGNKFYLGIATQFGLDEIYYLETENSYLTGTWYHVAGTYDGATMIIYVNGVEVASLEPTFDGNIRYRDTYYVIGAYKDSSETYEFDGQIDEVRIWNGARSPDEIRANMCKKLNPDIEANLLDYYHLDHSQGTFVDDYKGGNNNGTLMNMDSGSDWITSGAAIGDSSIYDYVGATATDFEVSLSHPDGDQLTATGQSGTYSGIHLYLVNESPTDTTPPDGWNPLHTGHYWGIFPVGDNIVYSTQYNYDGLGGIIAEIDLNMASRNNATELWGETSSIILDIETTTIETIETKPIEYIPGEKSAPLISEIDDQNTPYQSIPFTIEDSEGGDITIFATSTNLTLINNSDINLSCSDSYSCVINTTAFIESNITLTFEPSTGEHGKVSIELLATDSDGLTMLNSFNVIVSPSGSGNALSFDGVNQYVNIGNIDLSNKSFTVEFWAKRTIHTPEFRCVLGQGTGVANHRLFIGFRWEKFRVDFFDDDLDTTDSFSDYEWHHWAMSYKESSNDWILYRDGKIVESGTATADYQGTGDMIIGEWADAGSNFQGELDELRIWNGIRTQSEIRETLCKKLTGSENELIAYYRFDHISGSVLKDLTDNDHDGTLANMNDSNWITSGAFLGSESTFDYTGAVATDFNSSVSHSDGDSIAVTGTSGSFEGIHVYRVEGPANHNNTDADFSALDQNRHWGVFPVGSGELPIDLFYHYAGNPTALDDENLKILARNDHSDSEWRALTATQDINADTFFKSSLTACEFIIGIMNHTPDIIQGDAISTLMDKNCWPRAWDAPTIVASDADGDPLTWTIFSGPSHGIIQVTGEGASPCIYYTPTNDFVGYDSFVLKVVDGHEGGEDSITINVTVKSGINKWNLPAITNKSPAEGANEILHDNQGLNLFHMGPGRMIMPRMKVKVLTE